MMKNYKDEFIPVNIELIENLITINSEKNNDLENSIDTDNDTTNVTLSNNKIENKLDTTNDYIYNIDNILDISMKKKSNLNSKLNNNEFIYTLQKKFSEIINSIKSKSSKSMINKNKINYTKKMNINLNHSNINRNRFNKITKIKDTPNNKIANDKLDLNNLNLNIKSKDELLGISNITLLQNLVLKNSAIGVATQWFYNLYKNKILNNKKHKKISNFLNIFHVNMNKKFLVASVITAISALSIGFLYKNNFLNFNSSSSNYTVTNNTSNIESNNQINVNNEKKLETNSYISNTNIQYNNVLNSFIKNYSTKNNIDLNNLSIDSINKSPVMVNIDKKSDKVINDIIESDNLLSKKYFYNSNELNKSYLNELNKNSKTIKNTNEYYANTDIKSIIDNTMGKIKIIINKTKDFIHGSKDETLINDDIITKSSKKFIKTKETGSNTYFVSKSSAEINQESYKDFISKITPKGTISSTYGMRDNKPHNGIDIASPKGTPVYNTENGIVYRVLTADKNNTPGTGYYGYGSIVHVLNENGTSTLYAHLDDIKVNANDKVKAGDLIGTVGNTGKSSGSHLHYENRIGLFGKSINPYMYNSSNGKIIMDINKNTYKPVLNSDDTVPVKDQHITSDDVVIPNHSSQVAKIIKPNMEIPNLSSDNNLVDINAVLSGISNYNYDLLDSKLNLNDETQTNTVETINNYEDISMYQYNNDTYNTKYNWLLAYCGIKPVKNNTMLG